MQKDFHYYATYCAAYLAGYCHEESLDIAYSAQFVDECSVTLLKRLKAPLSAATTQLQLEMMDIRINPISLQNITRIWTSFHFLPYDLYASPPGKRSKAYLNKYRLICKPNGDLLVDTVELAKGKSLQAVGIAMHILADTWAHSYFAGTPSLVINNTNFQFYEITPTGEKPIIFHHNPATEDQLDRSHYTSTLYQENENSIMNLGHGRAGHLPDYSFIRYKYLPAWGDYQEVIKDNPAEYYNAFGQMVHAMRYLRGELPFFEKNNYSENLLLPWNKEINTILQKRQLHACEDWNAFGEKLSGRRLNDFDTKRLSEEYQCASSEEKKNTFLGKFLMSALAQKSMVTNSIFKSGNLCAGFSVDFELNGFKGIKDYLALVDYWKGGEKR